MSHAPLLTFAVLSLGIIVAAMCYRWLRREWLGVCGRETKDYQGNARPVRSSEKFPSTEQRSKLIASLKQHSTHCVGVQVYSFLRFASSQVLANEIFSALREAGFLAAYGNAEGQPFCLDQDKYHSDVWVLGEDRDRIAFALVDAELEGIHIDRRIDIEGNCIVIGNIGSGLP